MKDFLQAFCFATGAVMAWCGAIVAEAIHYGPMGGAGVAALLAVTFMAGVAVASGSRS